MRKQKHKAERMLIDETEKMNITLNVFRPSIIIGDTEKGKTLLFNTLYHALKILVALQNFAFQNKKENNGANAELMGITFDEKGEILFPLRIMSGSNINPTINIVTIDFVIKSCMAIRDNAPQGGTYHITNNQPLAIQMIIDNLPCLNINYME